MALTKIDDRGLTTPIDLLDNEKIRFGTGNDLEIYHNSNNSYIQDTGTGNLHLTSNGTAVSIDKGTSENMAVFNVDGAVDLYYDGVKTFNTVANGIQVRGTEGVEGHIYLYADEGDDYADLWLMQADQAVSGFYIRNKASGSWEDNIKAFGNGSVELYYDGNKKAETVSTGLLVSDTSGIASLTVENSSNSTRESAVYIKGRHSNGTVRQLMIKYDDDDTYRIHTAGSIPIILETNDVAQMYISSNTVGIGTTSTSGYFSKNLVVNGGASGGITIVGGTTHSNFLCFADGTSGDARYSGYVGYDHNADDLNIRANNGQKGIDIKSNGNLSITDGNLVLASGHGIDFSATGEGTGSGTSMDSELLDDYERGTWGSINSGADSCTFSHNWYVKVGRKVTCNIRCGGITNGNGSAFVLNLPFANGTVEASGAFACDTFNTASDWVQMTTYAYDQKLYVLCSRDNAGWENLLGNQTANNSTLIMNITYLATA